MSSGVRRGVLLLVGVLLLQAAWILAVPPFRGSDEFDHAYRAAGVASGQWHLTQEARDGRGLLVWVPRGLVSAASAQCASQSYTGHDNCFPVQERGDDVQVATAAGPYDPTYYWLVGTVAKPFRGDAALYVMRITTAVVCAVLLALGGVVFSMVGPGRWATVGVLAALTPQVMYSTAVVAPNGPEMGFGFLLWASLYAALQQRLPTRVERGLLCLGIGAAVVLTYLRFLGPLWVACIVLSVIGISGMPACKLLIRRRKRLVILGAALVALAALWWASWNLIARQVVAAPGAVTQPSDGSHDWSQVVAVPLWLMQMVGAFPYREYPAPLWVYPVAFLLIGGLALPAMLAIGPTAAPSRALRWVVLTMVVIPVVISAIYLTSKGTFWQGRYELPFALGILPTCGRLLDQRGYLAREGLAATRIAVIALCAVHVACVAHVMHAELRRPVSMHQEGWVHPGVGLVSLVALVGAMALCAIAPLRREATVVAARDAAAVGGRRM